MIILSNTIHMGGNRYRAAIVLIYIKSWFNCRSLPYVIDVSTSNHNQCRSSKHQKPLMPQHLVKNFFFFPPFTFRL